jgi:hypothetical protein
MVLNGWWHREERRTFECTDDESSPDITYGRAVKLGNSAKRLLVPTLADELRGQKPGSRTVAISSERSAIGLLATAATPSRGSTTPQDRLSRHGRSPGNRLQLCGTSSRATHTRRTRESRGR